MINSYVLGVGMWVVIGNEFVRQNIFFKIWSVCVKETTNAIRKGNQKRG